ncbi:hypothetical protein QL285_026560 [Trifolium repens]|nr:hypothetical protein QL285_026560 [Trifolium repens]
MSRILNRAWSSVSGRSSRSNRTLVPPTSSDTEATLNQDTFQNQELEVQEMENKLINWNMPEIKLNEVYKISTFDFKSQKIIHTLEQARNVKNKQETFTLLDKKLLDQHYKNGFRYIHLGLVQVAVKPLHKLGLNSPILLILRDSRIRDFHDSVIAMLESNLNDGPVYFNCYPNYSMSLGDEITSSSLVICVQHQNDNFTEGISNVDIITRITYKVTNVNYNYKSLRSTPRNETCIIEANLKKSSIITPKILTISELKEKIPEEWVIENTMQPEKLESRSIRDIITDQDGNIRIRMNRSQSFRYNQSPSIGSSSARHSVDSTIRLNLAGVNFAPNIPQPIYQERISRSPSPTESQILGMIKTEEPFEIDKVWIREEFLSDYNKEKRKWYFDTFQKNERDLYLKLFYEFLEHHEINIYFFTWFELYCLENNILNSYAKKLFLNTKTRMSIKWKTSKKEIVESIHPPLEAFKITPPKENIEIEASPFKAISNLTEQKKDINNVHSQLNYTNQILYTMSQQLDRIEQFLPETLETKVSDPTRPIYHYNIPTDKEIKDLTLGYNPEQKLDELVDRLKVLNVGSTSEVKINTLSFEEDNIISRIDKPPRPKTRNYYPRPSFADVQFEERNSFIGDSYSGDCIIEWNIDGASEQHILNIIQNMTMAATAFKIKKNSDRKTKDMLVMGFTGQLKGWWDNILSEEDKMKIDSAIKTETNEEICVTTLLYAITKFFIGEPLKLQQRASDQLLNLYCPTMSDYRWYKDMFLSKLCLRPDGAAIYWKERFISGLPRLFAEKVKKQY